jgi:[ribosomal protein S5]-alanine N-acetyltransferase
MLTMPILETQRLLIRPFMMEDLADVYQLFDIDLRDADMGSDQMDSLEERAEWLRWAALNPVQLAKLHQPPYGDRAIVLKSSGALIGACGYVPCLNAYEQVPGFAPDDTGNPVRYTPEFGLFYAISPAHRRQGYAAEAARTLVDYAFQKLGLKRIIAETNYDNAGSIGVMQQLGMRIERNPLPEPPWLQVVGVLESDWYSRTV